MALQLNSTVFADVQPTQSNKWKWLGVGALAVLLLGGFYSTPYWALNQAKKAADLKDATKLAQYVDFPAVKESIKANISAIMMAQVTKSGQSNNPFQALGVALAGAMITPVVDSLVSPEGLALMFRGQKPELKTQDGTASTDTDKRGDTQTEMGYEDFDHFVVRYKKSVNDAEPVGMVFKRDGLLSWKLSAIRLPENFAKQSTATDAPAVASIPPLPGVVSTVASAVVEAVSSAATPTVKLVDTSGQFTPSFDCAKVSSGAERMICSNRDLAAADVKLAQRYAAVKEYAIDLDVLRAEQNHWRTTERDACSDAQCMLDSYTRRTDALTQLLKQYQSEH